MPAETVDVLLRSITSDIEAGEGFITLNAARRDRRMLLNGKARDIGWIYRAIAGGVRGVGGRVVLEHSIQSGVRVVTPGAIARFVHRQMHGTGTAAPPSAADAVRAHADTENQLAAAGL